MKEPENGLHWENVIEKVEYSIVLSSGLVKRCLA